jgi:hypothetical protein
MVQDPDTRAGAIFGVGFGAMINREAFPVRPTAVRHVVWAVVAGLAFGTLAALFI